MGEQNVGDGGREYRKLGRTTKLRLGNKEVTRKGVKQRKKSDYYGG